MRDSFTDTGTNQPGNFYQPVSKVTLRGIVLALIFGTLITVLASWIYVELMLHPTYAIFDYLLLIATFFFFYTTILASATSGLLTNKFVIKLLLTILGACLIYTKCVLYIRMVTHAWPHTFEPEYLYHKVIFLVSMNPVYLYSMKIAGKELINTWLTESLIIVILGMLITKSWLEDTIICHDCSTEIEEPTISLTLDKLPCEHSLGYWKDQFIMGDFSAIEKLQPVDWHADSRTLVKLYSCKCGNLNIINLDVDSIEMRNPDSTTTPKRVTQNVIKNLVISQSNYAMIKNLR
jgi:hypothetical protein